MAQQPHRRYNPLLSEWILVSPHRVQRPWQGQGSQAKSEAKSLKDSRPVYDPECYLCPGNSRVGGNKMPLWDGCYVFENDFPAVFPPPGADEPCVVNSASLFQAAPAHGRCFVICYSPKHNTTVAEMSEPELRAVVDTWVDLYKKVSEENPKINYIQIFENKGQVMGCSNNHPHSQSWTMSYIPKLPAKILESQKNYSLSTKQTHLDVPHTAAGLPSLLLTYAAQEIQKHQTYLGEPDVARSAEEESRVVVLTEHFVAIIPWWAEWPFESIIVPFRRHVASVTQLQVDEKADLAKILGLLTRKMDNLFETSFPYSMGLYQAPVDRATEEGYENYCHLFIDFKPPLLRSATVRKFAVGYDIFAETQRDITPEIAAAQLRQCPDSLPQADH